MSIMVGTGRGAHRGVLIKDAEALETLEKVDTLVVDKTGTLTEGKPDSLYLCHRGDLWRRHSFVGSGVEQPSEHPLAPAIVKGRRTR